MGATPVFVDINPDTWNIEVDEIDKNITEKTKAIIVVSLYGLPVDIDPIMELARKHNIVVIDDSAETVFLIIRGVFLELVLILESIVLRNRNTNLW